MSKQQQILQFIKDYYAKYGYSPSIREIGKAVGIASSSTIHGYLEKLKKQGLIDYEPYLPRTIKVIDNTTQNEVTVLKYHKEIPSVIQWQGRRYVYDPVR